MDTPQEKGKLDLSKLFEGTMIGAVRTIAESGNFFSFPDEVQENESVIGEMTVFEKALLTYADQKMREHNEFVDRLRKRFSTEPPTREEEGRLVACRKAQDLAMDLLWHSVRERLGAYGPPFLSIALRGFQVVKTPSRKERSMGLEDVAGIHIVGIGGGFPMGFGFEV